MTDPIEDPVTPPEETPADPPPETPPPEDAPPKKETPSPKSSDPDFEKKYKGLQSASEKQRRKLADDLEAEQDKVTALTKQLAEAGGNTDLLTAETEAKTKELEEAQTQLTTITGEKKAVEDQLERQEVIATEFPGLTGLGDYIPTGDSIDDFKVNAKKFEEKMGSRVDDAVSEKLKGATPPAPTGDDEVTSTEQDKAYNKVVALAGVAGKEDEYSAALDLYQEKFPANPETGL